MKNWILPLLLLLCAASSIKADTSAINATLRTPTGDLFTGTVQISAPDMDCVIGGVTTKFVRWSKTFTVGSTGVLSVSLQANDACTVPDNQQNWYKLTYTPSTGSFTRGTTWVEYWYVPTSPSTITEIPRSTATVTTPAGVVSLIQLKSDGASNGQFLRYNAILKKWEPATVTPGAATWATTGDKPTEFPQRCATAGTSTAYTCAPTPALTALTTGQTLTLSVHVNSADGGSLNVNGLGARTLKKIKNGQLKDLEAGDITTNAPVLIRYDGTFWIAIPFDWNSGMSDSLLAYYSDKLMQGQTVTIDVRGDSTMWGYKSGVGSQLASNAVTELKNTLDRYYGNSAAVVQNNGISGYGTHNVRPLWDGWMSTSTGDIVYLNYGINDAQASTANCAGGPNPPCMTPFVEYVDNLRYMVRTARRYGKVVIFDMPNPTAPGDNPRSERMRTYKEGMRQVAQEMNVPIIDNFELFNDLIKSYGIGTTLPDLTHPGDAYYLNIGRNLALPLIGGALYSTRNGVQAQEFVLPTQMNIFGTNGAKVTNSTVLLATRFQTYVAAPSISAPVFIRDRPSDLRAAFFFGDVAGGRNVSNAVEIFIDGVSQGTMSLYDTASGGAGDVEVTIAKNVSPGLHVVTMTSNQSGAHVFMYYLRTNTEKPTGVYSPLMLTTLPRVYELEARYRSSVATIVQGSLLRDIHTSWWLNNITISVDIDMVADSGFFVAGAIRTAATNPQGGYYLFLGPDGSLRRSETGAADTNINVVTLDASNSVGEQHFDIQISTAGVVTVYRNYQPTVIDTYTLTHPWKAGAIGLWSKTATAAVLHKVVVLDGSIY